MTPACVIKPHRAGLLSNVNKIITCLRMYSHVHVDWSAGSLYGDCWPDLFEPTVQHYWPSDIVTDYPFYDLTAAMAGVLYQNEGWGWRDKCHEQWKKLGCKIKGDDVPHGTVGILVRCDNHRGEQLTDRSQSLAEYAQALSQLDYKSVYVVTTDNETLDWFVTRYGASYDHGTKRNAKRSDPDRHLTEPQTVEDAIQVMREVLTLANCDYLIHPCSNMSTCALYVNPNLKGIYLK